MVSGHYVAKFADASHVLFEGSLDDPSFRQIAIQRITQLDGDSVTLARSGALKIGFRNGKQVVRTSYHCFIFGQQKTVGSPFKDGDTAAIGASTELALFPA
jgi:hypothetical protein